LSALRALALDIGKGAAQGYARVIRDAQTVFANGPMGVFERPETEAGTRIVWEALGNTGAFTVIGGGDSVTAARKFGVAEKLDYVCTGGGALIRFLTGEELPVVRALRHAAAAFPPEGGTHAP
jgi:phosphoglycerate kinase